MLMEGETGSGVVSGKNQGRAEIRFHFLQTPPRELHGGAVSVGLGRESAGGVWGWIPGAGISGKDPLNTGNF